jgi:hypothetical protein
MRTIEDVELQGQDLSGVLHRIVPGRCRCGCTYLYAVDDCEVRWLVGDWESEDQQGDRCVDRTCACHRRLQVQPPRLVTIR